VKQMKIIQIGNDVYRISNKLFDELDKLDPNDDVNYRWKKNNQTEYDRYEEILDWIRENCKIILTIENAFSMDEFT